jgi:TonB-linked SusC/RagA family outer membrane protein
MEELSSTPPNAAPGVVNGKIVTISTIPGGGTFSPITPLTKGWHQDYENNMNGSIRLNYKMDYLLKGLALRGTASYRNFNTEVKTFGTNGIITTYDARPSIDGGPIYLPNGDPQPVGYGSETKRNRYVYAEAGVFYERTFGVHNVTGLVLYNQSKYFDPDLAFLIPNGYQGIVGRVTYNFLNRYFFDFNIGYNGTENFAVGKRFGVFPAYSPGWVLTEEKFIPKNKWLSFAKLRVYYGVVGNDKIGGDRFLYRPTSYTYSDPNKPVYYWGDITNRNGYAGATEGKLGNPDLTWEKAKKLNYGADIKLLNNRIGLTVDYFTDRRNNILWNKGTLPVITGMDMPAYNLGIMNNSGYEGELTYTGKAGNDFLYYAKANYTYAHNKIEYMDEVYQPYPYRYQTGQRYGQFFGYVADGIYNTWAEVNDPNRPVYQWDNNKIQPGDIKYKDINGDGKIDDNDQVPIGYSNFPEVMFGLTLGGSYKGFDFSILLQGATHVSNMPSRRTMRGFYTDTGANNDLLKSWSQERYDNNLEIKYPRYSITNDDHNYVGSTFWLEDASYVRLKNAEVGYTLKSASMKKAGISSVRIYLNGNNLLTFDRLKFPGEDPEYPQGQANNEPYPVTRIFNAGLNINF